MVAVPGEFAQLYPNTTNSDLTAALADGFAVAQLDGFFQTSTLNTLTWEVFPDLSPSEQMVVCTYAGINIVMNEIRTVSTMERYQAGPVEMEKQYAASVLERILLMLEERRKSLLQQGGSRSASTFLLRDGYLDRLYYCPSVFPIPG